MSNIYFYSILNCKFQIFFALHRQGLVPRILSGTSAGSIVAAFVGVKTDAEMDAMLFDDPSNTIVNLITSLPFFGIQRDKASEQNFADLLAVAGGGNRAEEAATLLRDATRPLKNVGKGRPMLDQRILRAALAHLCGDLTFLEAFDRTGTVLY